MKICTIIGARPQFIKAAVVSRSICKHNNHENDPRYKISEIIVHTGQHYDYEMSQIFFEQLDIPKPDHHLGIGSASHGEQTAKMLIDIEKVLIKEKPDCVLIYGDTNSTLAGALAAAKLNIMIAHIEAGLRSFNKRVPEEINRIIADTLSTILFAPTSTAVKNLYAEGITKGVYPVSDVMLECLAINLPIAEERSKILERLSLVSSSIGGKTKVGDYVLVTVHRAENTDEIEKISSIIKALNLISEDVPVVFPVHPRTRKVLEHNRDILKISPKINVIEPVPYLDILKLESNAKIILTDSGGIQKEAMWFGIPCITMINETPWVETVECGMNALSGANTEKIISLYKKFYENKERNVNPEYRGQKAMVAGEQTVKILLSSLQHC